MITNCNNCGGILVFSPKDKGNVCESCGAILPLKYNYKFTKKPFEQNINLDVDELAESMKNLKCKSCGANVLLSKFKLQTKCPYCDRTTIVEGKNKKLMYIDSIIPFTLDREEALKKFKSAVNKRIYADRKVFKHISQNNVVGAYINAFVFDIKTSNTYLGTFSYCINVKDSNGNSHTEKRYKTVSGTYDKEFKNLTIEANSNLEQRELVSILPFDYTASVEFRDEFMNGYMLEYQNKMFDECVKTAEKVMKEAVKRDLLSKYECEHIENLSLDVKYSDRKYNYCLLPVYIINNTVKDKKYKVVMNGQTGKVGKLPKNKFRIILTIFLSCGLVVGLILLLLLLL